MPPGLLPTPCLDRQGECVATYFLALEGPAADQPPRAGKPRPTNRDNASFSRLRTMCRCDSASVPPPDRIRCGATVLRPSCVHRCQLTGRTTGRYAPLGRAAAHREFGAKETRRPPG